MGKVIKISESQLKRLKIVIKEGLAHSNVVKQMKTELDMNYECVQKFVREGGDYTNQPMFKVKVDEEEITAKALYEYMMHKYKVGEAFTQQVIKDWVDNKITDDYQLSKNIALN